MTYNTPARLASYRRKAADPKNVYPDAKHWRYWKRNIWATPNIKQRDGMLFSDSVDQYGDYLGDAHTLARIDHTGWYADNFQDNLIVGGVAKLRCTKGTLYIPVTHHSQWDGTIHWMKDAVLVEKGSKEFAHEDAVRQAARGADQNAEDQAEEAREDDAKYRAERDIEDARTEIHEINRKVLALIKEIKTHGMFSPNVCGALRERVQEYINGRRAAFLTISAREDDYWSAVQ